MLNNDPIYCFVSCACIFLKEHAQAEGVSAKLGVALELAADLSCENGVPEMADYCEKVWQNCARLCVDVVSDKNGTGTRLTRADT
jgi:hypothetical protein